MQPTAVDIGTLVAGLTDLVATTCGPEVAVVIDIAADLPPARGDANQLEMALLNLAINARDAMPAGGTLVISAQPSPPDDSARPAGLPPEPFVRVALSDTGIGMDSATAARAIEPFFSTKGVGRGTGLGLSMAHGLSAQLGGVLTIDSAPGQGTEVAIWLPAAAAVPVATVAAGGEGVPTGTALVVDDEDPVRASTAAMLVCLGYTVVEARSAGEALALIDAGPMPQLVVTDHLMPGMTGSELARAVRDRDLDLPVLIVSGYAEDAVIADGLPRLAKPFRLDALERAVADLVSVTLP